MNVVTRVTLAWYASTISSYISRRAPRSRTARRRDAPAAAARSSPCAFSARWIRRSISRTLSRYCVIVWRSDGAELDAAGRRPRLAIASRMLRSSWMRATRSAGAAALAEHPLEHLARVDLHRQRRRRRPPRQRVHVDAAVVAVARADQARVVLGGELHRRQRRVLADGLRRQSGRRSRRRRRPRPAWPSGARRSARWSGSASARRWCPLPGGRAR